MLVLVAESDANLRAALCVWVGHVPGASLAGVARNRRELLPALNTSHADLVLLDWELLADQAERMLATARHLEPAPCIVVLATQLQLLEAANSLGVEAVVDKGKLPIALFEVLNGFHAGAVPRQGVESSQVDGE